MRWLYHALPRAAPTTPLVPRYAPESLAREGFVHCSFRGDLLGSVRAHEPPGAVLDVLQIDPRRLDVALLVADTPRGPMPHIQGTIPRDAIVRTYALEDFERAVPELPDRVEGTRFAFVAFEGMTLLDLVGAYDPVSRLASTGLDASSTTEIIGAHRGRVFAHAGAELSIDRARPLLDEFDVLVIPGGPGTRVLEHDQSLVEWLRSYPENRLVASVCTGALLLGAAGRLRGKNATTHHLWLHRLQDYGATAVAQRVVDDGQLITAAGVTSAIDLGLRLVERLEGKTSRLKISAQMEWPPPFLAVR